MQQRSMKMRGVSGKFSASTVPLEQKQALTNSKYLSMGRINTDASNITNLPYYRRVLRAIPTYHSIKKNLLLLKIGPIGMGWDVAQVVMSLIACVLYVVETYSTSRLSAIIFRLIENILTQFFLVDFLINLITSTSLGLFLTSSMTWVDIVTIFPVYLSFITGAATPSLGILRFARILRLIRILRTFRMLGGFSGVKRQVIVLGLTLLSLIFLAAGIFNLLENDIRQLSYDCKYLSADTGFVPSCSPDESTFDEEWCDCEERECIATYNAGDNPGEPTRLRCIVLPFFDCLYYIVVTVACVGYGDIKPSTTPSRVAIVLFIITTLVIIPIQINKIILLLSMSSMFRRAFEPRPHEHHIILCGQTNKRTKVERMFREFFHPDRSSSVTNEYHVVILSPLEPSDEMKDMLFSPLFDSRVTYVIGSALSMDDLQRARADIAVAMFFLCNIEAEEDEAMLDDAATVLRTLSVSNFNPQLECLVQVLRPQDRDILKDSDVDVILCLDEYKTVMQARNAVCQGLSTFIENLFHTFGTLDPTPIKQADHWSTEYMRGARMELYYIPLSIEFLRLMQFEWALLVESMFLEFECTLIGVTSMEVNAVVFNPTGLDIKGYDNLEAFYRKHNTGIVICSNHTAAELIRVGLAEFTMLDRMQRKLMDAEDHFSIRKASAMSTKFGGSVKAGDAALRGRRRSSVSSQSTSIIDIIRCAKTQAALETKRLEQRRVIVPRKVKLQNNRSKALRKAFSGNYGDDEPAASEFLGYVDHEVSDNDSDDPLMTPSPRPNFTNKFTATQASNFTATTVTASDVQVGVELTSTTPFQALKPSADNSEVIPFSQSCEAVNADATSSGNVTETIDATTEDERPRSPLLDALDDCVMPPSGPMQRVQSFQRAQPLSKIKSSKFFVSKKNLLSPEPGDNSAPGRFGLLEKEKSSKMFPLTKKSSVMKIARIRMDDMDEEESDELPPVEAASAMVKLPDYNRSPQPTFNHGGSGNSIVPTSLNFTPTSNAKSRQKNYRRLGSASGEIISHPSVNAPCNKDFGAVKQLQVASRRRSSLDSGLNALKGGVEIGHARGLPSMEIVDACSFSNHIIIYGCVDNLQVFIAELRRPLLPMSAYHPIIIVHPHEPPKWRQLKAQFDDIYFMNSRVNGKQDMTRLNVRTAHSIVLLASRDFIAMDDSSNVDSEVLFAYLKVERFVPKTVFFSVELVCPNNMGVLNSVIMRRIRAEARTTTPSSVQNVSSEHATGLVSQHVPNHKMRGAIDMELLKQQIKLEQSTAHRQMLLNKRNADIAGGGGGGPVRGSITSDNLRARRGSVMDIRKSLKLGTMKALGGVDEDPVEVIRAGGHFKNFWDLSDTHHMLPVFAASRAYVPSTFDSMLCQSFFCALTTSVCEKLVCGQEYQTILMAPVPRPFYGRIYSDLFRSFVSRNVMPLALLRTPLPKNSASLPYVYTTPNADTMIHGEDNIMLLGNPHTIESALEQLSLPLIRKQGKMALGELHAQPAAAAVNTKPRRGSDANPTTTPRSKQMGEVAKFKATSPPTTPLRPARSPPREISPAEAGGTDGYRPFPSKAKFGSSANNTPQRTPVAALSSAANITPTSTPSLATKLFQSFKSSKVYVDSEQAVLPPNGTNTSKSSANGVSYFDVNDPNFSSDDEDIECKVVHNEEKDL